MKLYWPTSAPYSTFNGTDIDNALFITDLPEGSISQLQVVDSRMSSLEAESLAGCQVQALTLPNNRIQHIADRAFR